MDAKRHLNLSDALPKHRPVGLSSHWPVSPNMIDLRSDTFTQPSHLLRQRMFAAEVGDDYYREDPSVNRLQDYCKELFRVEDALFCTSGMLANLLAFSVQAGRGAEVVTEYNYHANLYESAQHAAFGGYVLNGITTADGILRAEDLERAIASKPREPVYSQVALVSIENPISSFGGKLYPIEELRRLRALTKSQGIKLHLDGARIFNAHVATGIPLSEYAREADTMTVSFSKGLGAPFGSAVLGSRAVIDAARRLRVWHGSGMHQCGIYAEAALAALTCQMDRLHEDHRLAQLLATKISEDRRIAGGVCRSETNMVVVDLTPAGDNASCVVETCRELGLLVQHLPPNKVRFVVSREISEREVYRAATIVRQALDLNRLRAVS
jgi:threonine aldolase